MSAAGARVPVALIVDDDPMMRLLIGQTLEQVGFVCEDAEDGERALQRFAQLQPDLVLLDVMMPRLDGYQTCARLRTLPGGATVPVVMLTGLDDNESIARAYEAGATDFIGKPITWALLGHRVRYLLRASGAFRDLAKHQASLETAQRIAHLGSWELDLTRNEVYWSPETFRILGLEPGSIEPGVERLLAHVHAEDRALAQAAVHDLVKTGQFAARVVRMARPDNSLRHVQLQGMGSYDAQGTLTHLAGTIQDVTELKEAEQRIRHLTYFDAITGLPNRVFFMERLTQAVSLARRHQRQLGVLVLKLDQFNRINDTLGHSAGNELLVAVTRRLSDGVRGGDVLGRPEDERLMARDGAHPLARLDSDEFSLLLTDLAQYHDAAKVARRMLQQLSKPFRAGDQEVFVTASVGLALYPLDGDDADTLIRNASAAMHFAMEQGRDNYQFYSRAMNATALEKLSLESQLRRAVEREEFVLDFQPKLRAATGEIVGLESLIRWQHPELGLISPSQFISVAEESGLIVAIGEWVLRSACQQNQRWQAQGLPALRMAVNIASSHFRQGGLSASIAAALRDSGLDPALLEVELTESMLMQGVDAAMETLSRLKDMGVRLAIDDFGTGYSSLSYLKRLPLDTLKIDRSFVNDLPRNAEDAAITKAIIAMAHSLKLEVVAEGVETPEQLAFLQQHGCDLVQGFLFSQPVHAREVGPLLLKQQRRSA